MKYSLQRYTYLLIAALIYLSGCSSDDSSPFPDNRKEADEIINEIRQTLTTPQYGWKTTLIPDGEGIGGYNMAIKFSEDGTCEMVADYFEHDYLYGTNPFDAGQKQTSIRYGVSKVNDFELAFESYCFIHKLYELGLSSKFQYRVAQWSDNEVVLFDGQSRITMVPASADDWDVSAYMDMELRLKQYVDNSILFNYLHKDDAPRVQISTAFSNRSIGFFFYNEKGEVESVQSGYFFTTKGIVFRDTLHINGLPPVTHFDFGVLEDGLHSSKILNISINGQQASQFYSSVHTMIPVDDGIEHFEKVAGISIAEGGRFWSSRPRFEGGFRYGGNSTYFGIEEEPWFAAFSIYLDYYNAKLKDTYSMFSFVFFFEGKETFYDVYFHYETTGTDQIVFTLDEEKGNGGYSSYISAELREVLEPMINKMIQPEGFTLVSNPYVNPVDYSLSMYLVDNKDNGFMSMRTGTLGH